jgi:uncharacterized protein (TIGR03435 family)
VWDGNSRGPSSDRQRRDDAAVGEPVVVSNARDRRRPQELTGSFDIDLEWTPDQALPGAEGLTPAPDAISIFTAIKEQLGLKLEPHKGPVDVTVIDHIEKPTPD